MRSILSVSLGLVLVLVGSRASAGVEDNWTSRERVETVAKMLLKRATATAAYGPTSGSVASYAGLTKKAAQKLLDAIKQNKHPTIVNARFASTANTYRQLDRLYQKNRANFEGSDLEFFLPQLEKVVYRMNYNLMAGKIADKAFHLADRMRDLASVAQSTQATLVADHGEEVADEMEFLASTAEARMGFGLAMSDFQLARAMYCASEELIRFALVESFSGKYQIKSKAVHAQIAFRQLHDAMLTAIPQVMTSGSAGVWAGCGIKGFLGGPIHPDDGGGVIGLDVVAEF